MNIENIRDALKRLKEEGIKFINIDSLDQFLKTAEDSETSRRQDDDKFAELEHQSRLTQYNAEAELSRRLLDAAMDFAAGALKAVLLINGGAAIAVLSFLGNRNDVELTWFPDSLVSFTVGVLCAAIASGFAYVAQICYAETNKLSPGKYFRCFAVTSVVLSYVAFALGAYFAFRGFTT